MDIQKIWEILNQGISSNTLGSLTSAGVIALIQKMKSYFSTPDKIKKKDFESLLASNSEFQELSSQLYQHVQKFQQDAKIENVGVINNGETTISGGTIAGKIINKS